MVLIVCLQILQFDFLFETFLIFFFNWIHLPIEYSKLLCNFTYTIFFYFRCVDITFLTVVEETWFILFGLANNLS